MKRGLLYLAIAIVAFASGVVATNRWNRKAAQPQTSIVEVKILEGQWPLTKDLVSMYLQNYGFKTDKLERNSRNEIVWRWLKESIQAYPQNWVKLDISNDETYGIIIYPQEVLEPLHLKSLNRELEKKGLPPLRNDKRYRRINIYQSNVLCPNWYGLIDVEEAKLAYFEGQSG